MSSMTKVFHHTPYGAISPSNPNNSQAGRTVAITGSTGGIGYASAKAFVQANAARVILLGRQSAKVELALEKLKKEVSPTQTQILARVCDINSDASIENLWKSFATDGILVDVLILNATDPSMGPLTPLSNNISVFKTAFNANVVANSLMAARFLDATNETGKPKALLNVSTAATHANPALGQGLYSSSKTAFASLLQHVAEEIPADQCQIINYQPGVILTPGAKAAASFEAMQKVAVYDEVELPAAWSVWASTPAASFLHGRFAWANWDVEELKGQKELEDPGYLKMGLQGGEFLDIADHFQKVREKDAQRGQ